MNITCPNCKEKLLITGTGAKEYFVDAPNENKQHYLGLKKDITELTRELRKIVSYLAKLNQSQTILENNMRDLDAKIIVDGMEYSLPKHLKDSIFNILAPYKNTAVELRAGKPVEKEVAEEEVIPVETGEDLAVPVDEAVETADEETEPAGDGTTADEETEV